MGRAHIATRGATAFVVVALVAVVLGTGPTAPAAVAAEPAVGLATGPFGLVNDAVYDASRRLVYASVPGSDEERPNSIIAFDPATGSVVWTVKVGIHPDPLALTDDATKLYIGYAGAPRVDRLDLATRTVDFTVGLGDGSHGPRHAEDIEVLPGDRDVVVVTMMFPNVSPRHAGVAVIDESGMRPKVTAERDGPNVIELASATSAYGYTNESTAFGLWTLAIDGQGATIVDERTTEIRGFRQDIAYSDGLLFASDGVVVDAATGGLRAELNGGVESDGIYRPAVVGDLVYVIEDFPEVVRAYDTATFTQVGPEIRFWRNGASLRGMIWTHAGPLIWHSQGFATPRPGWLEGFVQDDRTGRIIVDVCVVVVDDHGREVAQVQTNGFGQYRSQVPSGIVRILFTECEYFDFFAEWHRDRVAFDVDGATPVAVGPDDVVRIDARLDRVFTDVARDSTFFPDIVWIRDAGITTGCGVERYCPGYPVTREQMAAFLGRLWRLLGGRCPGGPMPFVDVPSSSFAHDDVICIHGLGITTGTSPTTYSPALPVTREQMAAFLARFWRAFGATCPKGDSPFRDVRPTSFARTDIDCIFLLGITTGTGPTSYAPGEWVTREQMAAFLGRTGRLVATSVLEADRTATSNPGAAASLGDAGAPLR